VTQRRNSPPSDAPASSRLLKAGVLVTDLIVIGLAALVSFQSLAAHRAAAEVNARNLARLLDAGLSASFDKIDLALRAVADEHRRASTDGPIDGRALETFLARQKERTPDLLSIRITGPDGLTRYNAPPIAEQVTVADRDYFTSLRDRPTDGLFISHPFMGRIIRTPVLIAARRLPTPDGTFGGVVTGSVALAHLNALLSGMDVGPQGTVDLRAEDFTLVASKDLEGAAHRFGDTRVSQELRALVAAGLVEGTYEARSPVDDHPRTSAFRRLEHHPLLVVVGLSPDDYLAGWRRQTAVVWVLVAAFVLLTLGALRYGTPIWQRLEFERLLSERTEHLRESEERFRIAFQTSPDAINLTRLTDGTYVAVNEGFLRLTGYTEEEVVGRSALTLGIWDDPADRARLVAAVQRDGFMENLEARFRGKDGRVIIGLMSARRIELQGQPHLLTITRDVGAWKAAEAERDRLQLQFQQAQRLEGIGRLAGGVAHDFNNLLTVIIGCLESLREQVGATPALREDLDQITAAAGRARDLTRQLLAFARKQVIAPVPLDLAEVVRDSERLLQRVVGEDVTLSVETEPGLWPVLCDPAQLEQVILNLVVNARDAMPAGGTLSIAARNAEVELLLDPQTGERRLGRWVRLSVRDSGTGMTPEVQAHLFEPFFTTKPSGKGTGLGLATVHGIVAQNGGYIEVESAPGRGTTFDVFLPRAADPPAAPRPGAAPRTTTSCGETLLVIEDDPLVRNVTVRALRGAGYQVLVAGTGAEALSLLAQHEGPLDLVVTDVIMPGLTGPQVVDELRRTRPGLRALFVSGYAQDAIAQRGGLPDGVELLPKPFTSTSLLARVAALLVTRGADRAGVPASRPASR
jgi:PAS domain S-box-containing protein